MARGDKVRGRPGGSEVVVRYTGLQEPKMSGRSDSRVAPGKEIYRGQGCVTNQVS